MIQYFFVMGVLGVVLTWHAFRHLPGWGLV